MTQTITKPPDILQGDPVAIAEWNRLIEVKKQLGLMPELDQTIMMFYCQACGAFCKESKTLQREPFFYQPDNGIVLLNPRVRLVRDLLNEIIKTSKHLSIKEFQPRPPKKSRAEKLFRAPVYRKPKGKPGGKK